MAEPDKHAAVLHPQAAEHTVIEDARTAQHIQSELEVFRFSDLPPELRLRIIEFAVTQKKPIQITKLDFLDSDEERGILLTEQWRGIDAVANRTQPSLTRTCREVRVDALKLYYICNDFRGSYCKSSVCFKKLYKWLQCIGTQNRGLVKSLEIYDVNFEGDSVNDECMEGLQLSDSDGEDDGGELDSAGARARLSALGATIEAAVNHGPGVYMVNFPKVKVKD